MKNEQVARELLKMAKSLLAESRPQKIAKMLISSSITVLDYDSLGAKEWEEIDGQVDKILSDYDFDENTIISKDKNGLRKLKVVLERMGYDVSRVQ